MSRWRAVAIVGLLAGWPAVRVATPAASEPPPLPDVLHRAPVSVAERQRQLSGIVAEEQYLQDVRSPRRWGKIGGPGVPPGRHRELKADLLLVKPIGSNRWMQFRDVFEVDGRPVRDRSERHRAPIHLEHVTELH